MGFLRSLFKDVALTMFPSNITYFSYSDCLIQPEVSLKANIPPDITTDYYCDSFTRETF